MRELCNKPAESALIAIMMQSNLDTIVDISSQITKDHFSSFANAGLFEVIKALVSEGRELNTLNLSSEIKKHGKLVTALGGESNIIDSIECLKTAEVDLEEYEHYIEELKKYVVSKKILEQMEKIKEKILNDVDTMSLGDVLSEPENLYVDVSEANKIESYHIGDGIENYLNKSQEDIGKLLGIPSVYPSVNKITLGYKPGRIYTFSAASGKGKSLFLMNEANHIAIDLQIPTLYIDTENLIEQQQPRLLSIRTGLDSREFELGTFLQSQIKKEIFQRELQAIKNGKLYFTPIVDFDEGILGSIIRYHVVKYGIKVVIFDYIKLPNVEKTDGLNETQKLGNLTNYIKNIVAKKMNLVVLTACQTDEFGGSNRPADSQRIKRFSDFLANWREKSYDQINKNGWEYGTHELEIQKWREGKSGDIINFIFTGNNSRILESVRSNSLDNFGQQSLIPTDKKSKNGF